MLDLNWKRDLVLDFDRKRVDCKRDTEKSEAQWDTMMDRKKNSKSRGEKFYILSVFYIVIVIHYY